VDFADLGWRCCWLDRGTCALGQIARSAPRHPNIIFILADDLGYGDLGCYGQTRIKTPNIDKLAAEGIRFTDFYAGSTVCAPSRNCLMTGQDTGHATIRGNKDGSSLSATDFTIAQLLKQSGYRTGLVGKWGLGDEGSPGLPQLKGFDQFGGYLDQRHAHDYYTDHLFRYSDRNQFSGRQEIVENREGAQKTYIPDLFANAAREFVRTEKPDAVNNQRPFFLYWATIIPHANDELGQKTGNGMQVPSDAPYSTENWPQVEKNKAAMITRLDSDVGALMERLRKLKLDDDTIVFFSSDNGPHKEGGVDPKFFESSGPMRGIKRDLYEGGIRVPMIVRWPGRIPTNTVSHEPGAFWDIMPTLADIIGARPPVMSTNSISLLPTLLGHAQTNHHQYLYWEFHEGGSQQAVRMGEWKAVRPKAGSSLELYDLKSDLGEKSDVASKNPEVVKEIEVVLANARSDSKFWPIKKAPK